MWEGFVGNPRGQPWNVGEHVPGLIYLIMYNL
jgi:hypothetical protein